MCIRDSSGMGELHLDVLVDRLKREHKVEANVGAPQVSYRETFRAGTPVSYTHLPWEMEDPFFCSRKAF